jgi:sulfate transport system ATP-binding protein
MSIEVRNLTKTFGNYVALRDVSLHIGAGELVALLGPSGSGKTTLLRVIAGLESADPGSGAVLFHDRDVSRKPLTDRKVGFVFQHYALFRHMSVFENVAFGLRARPRRLRPGRDEIRQRVTELLRLVQLDRMADRYPSQLSGGQRQRVALARALAVEPSVLLLDEPFGALDAKVRRELRRWLRHLHDQMHITTVFVTHDQEEALELADRIAILRDGRIEQVGTPEHVYDHPATSFVYSFLGNVNLFHGRFDQGTLRLDGAAVHTGASREIAVGDTTDGRRAVAWVRPHDVEITRERINGDAMPATIERVSFAGANVHVLLARGSSNDVPAAECAPIEAAVSRQRWRELGLREGDEVWIQIHDARTFAEDYSI